RPYNLPKNKKNTDVLTKASEDFKFILTETYQSSFKDQLLRFSNILLEPISYPYENLIINKIIEGDLLADIDIVEIHYSQLMRLIPKIKNIKKDIPVFFYSHDVYYQSIQRFIQSKETPLFRKCVLQIKNLNIHKKERFYLNQADRIFTFSKKDCELLCDIGVTTPCQNVVLLPEFDSDITHISSNSINILFVGAFRRKANFQGALWLLKNVWPSLEKKYENVKLYLAGSHPTQEMLSYASERVVLTGFVDDLDYYHKLADIVVVPLFIGAGVKYKVLHSFYFQLPVVSTVVGAEGIQTKAFAAITDDKNTFIKSIEELIENEKLRLDIGHTAKKILEEEYNFTKKTINVLLDAYEQGSKSAF
ncbi:MAG TPA: glycosyltransferase, partial [Saprospiraceae bacterium]|nr:glycosyltransferase [Saprospiraceae bacterium]